MNESQRRAIEAYRERLASRGIARFEVHAPEQDRELLRTLARRLAAGGSDAANLRAWLTRTLEADPDILTRGGIYRALRRSPLVGAELDLSRDYAVDREIDLS
jgi:hypothetical protein